MRVRMNGLAGCCLKTLRRINDVPDNFQIVDCEMCSNRMWYRLQAWEWFADKKASYEIISKENDQ